MNRKKRIIISITGITIVLLALIGLTYGYFLTVIRGNTKDKSIIVDTANLELVYDDDDGSIIGEGELIEPGTKFTTKTFTVANNGNAAIDSYSVILENVSTTYASTFIDENDNEILEGTPVAFKRPQDFKISITCSSKKKGETSTTSCNGTDKSTLPLMKSEILEETYITNGILVSNTIEVGEVHTYSVVLEYVEAKVNQSDDMDKKLEGRFNIIDTNNTADIIGYVNDFDLGDQVITNSVRRVSQINSDGSYKIVGLEADIHNIKLLSNETETEIEKISIVKGETASVGTTTNNGETISELTITDSARVAKIDINTTSNTITPPTKIEIYNPFNEGTLAYNIINNASLGTNGTTFVEENKLGVTTNTSKPAKEISLENEKIVSTIMDDYGTSYYFRGNVVDNYVNYAGMCFRIVRILGDGSIKLVLEDKDTTCDNAAYTGNWGIANVSYGSDRYNINGVGVYQANYLNPKYLTNGSIKAEIDTWLTNSNINIDDLKEDTWCLGDITNAYSTQSPFSIISNESNTRDTLIQNRTAFFYEAFTRLGDEDANKVAITDQMATLKCQKNNYSSFTSYASLLSADEVVLGGAKQGSENSNYYLYNDYQNNPTGKNIKWYTLTLGKFSGQYDRVLGVDIGGMLGNMSVFQKNGTVFDTYARPAITLKNNISLDNTIQNQNGTKTNPYVIN